MDNPESIDVSTRYGKPSDEITMGKIAGVEVVFLPRHGTEHSIPPHKVPYRANIEAMASLGVERIIATNAIGSLKENFAPGNFVVFDQFVNFTQGRDDTFYDENVVAHVSSAHPYCDELRKVASAALESSKIKHHDTGTIVVINGPRFSSKAESRFFAAQGFDVIGMTQYPEAYLAREKGICYTGIGMVTDYDSGLEGRADIKPVDGAEVSRVFAANIAKVKELVLKMVPAVPTVRSCACKNALDNTMIH